MSFPIQADESLLDQAERGILAGDIPGALEVLFESLWWMRKTSTPESWDVFIKETAPKHSLTSLLREDPLTDHALRQPRGYPGDADLLDYIYLGEQTNSHGRVSERGRLIFRVIHQEPACRAVRARMRVVARTIDEIAGQTRGRVLSIACGHVREAGHCRALQDGRLERFVALDQDADTLKHVDRELGSFGVTTIREDIKNLILREIRLGEFDFVYSTGLYDYLSDRAARRLTWQLFRLLAPGGTLLIANVLPEIHDCGYMEAFMNWHLMYRNTAAMTSLLELINPEEYLARTFSEPNGNILFLELCRQGSRNVHERMAEKGWFDPVALEPAAYLTTG